MFGVAFVTTQRKIGGCPDNALQNTTKTLEKSSQMYKQWYERKI